MANSLDLSVPFTASGKFIELHQTGGVQQVAPIWNKFSSLQKCLAALEDRRSRCNEPGWLLQFAKNCGQQSKDFEKELQALVSDLENSKASLEEQCEKLYSRLAAIDPSLAHFARTFGWTRSSYGHLRSHFDRGSAQLNVLKRNWIIETNPRLTSSELCKRFDAEEISVPLQWTEQFHEVDCWTAAYRNPKLRKRIHKMISETKRQLLMP
jgi:hypothetical protein